MSGITVRPIDYEKDEDDLKSFLLDRDKMRLEHCRAAIDAGDAFIYVADQDGSAIGWAQVQLNYRDDQDWDPPDDDTRRFQSGENAYLENIEVTARSRSSGLGRRLLVAVQEEARKRGKRVLWLHTNENNALAHKVFEREGWTHESTIYPPWKPTSRTRIYKKTL